MLSSFASFLPAALHINQQPDLPRPNINPDTDDEDDADGRSVVAQDYADVEPQPPKGKEKEKLANEQAWWGRYPRSQLESINTVARCSLTSTFDSTVFSLLTTNTLSKSTSIRPIIPNLSVILAPILPRNSLAAAKRTFIFVRPPPSKSNHPLNLQVQLVPPNGKPPSGVVSGAGEGMATTPTSARSTSSNDGASLARTTSNRSDISYANSYNQSTASFGSVASSSASSSTRRAIIPLYNLQAHNVMTNVIVDAGTDAKIAKFQKRGIELIDLALLEPVEVWGEKDKEKDAKRESMRISVDETGALMTNLSTRGNSLLSAKSGGFFQPGSRPVTPSAGSSAASLHSQSHSNLRSTSSPLHKPISTQFSDNTNLQSGPVQMSMPVPVTMPAPQMVAPPQAPSPQKRNLFNKLFNKRNNSTTFDPAPEPPSERDSAPTFASFSLTPAPVAAKFLAKNDEKRGRRGTPPPALQEPLSPTSPLSSQTTPTQPQTPRQGDIVSPTPTVAPAKEKGHGRNLSLTSAITTPFKTTLKNNKNRLSAVITGGLSGGSGNNLAVPGSPVEDRDAQKKKRDVSPNPSMARSSRSQLSLHPTMSVDSSHGGHNGNGNEGGSHAQHQHQHQHQQHQQHTLYPLMQSQSQAREELVNLKQQQLQLRPPILGIQPTFVSASVSPPPPSISSPLVSVLSPRNAESHDNLIQGQRALMYVWLVRRWLKRRPSIVSNPFSDSGVFGGLKAGRSQESSSGGGAGGPAPLLYGGVEVRFEWKRAKGKESKGSKAKKSRRGRTSTGRESTFANDAAESDGEVERASVRNRTRERDAKERIRSESKRRNRMSTGSFSTTTASEEGTEGGRKLRRENTTTTDDGEESDPEDSETPWVCTLKVRRNANSPPGSNDVLSASGSTYHGRGGSASTSPQLQGLAPQVLRVKVGTLSPTPHHPKVVAMLKVPFPLPDVEVERMGIVRRKGFPIGGAGQTTVPAGEDAGEPYNGLTLTAEEIKDMVCSTGLWLVVREGFGGVGRVSRKGDGWRIRA
ncbi:hypothetical protein CVT25_003637 [Psilocybe cyanescens]|uniref:Uncharacterized protein n=1 Tax=Psilocybe cyanescens TaxID=93625 RepID=A0A409WPB4_PSICY|nr:hypothetical protein CVT25_003637 [Psilocybe cyanescens]